LAAILDGPTPVLVAYYLGDIKAVETSFKHNCATFVQKVHIPAAEVCSPLARHVLSLCDLLGSSSSSPGALHVYRDVVWGWSPPTWLAV